MLIRWQGNIATNSVFYNAGVYTGLTVPTPYSNWQRGYQPESQSGETPVVQLHCFDGGVVLNSFDAPHSPPVVGGGWNDMYGYAWSSGNRPYAFQYLSTINCGGLLTCWKPAELMLQGLISVPQTTAWQFVNGAWTQFTNRNLWQEAGTAQVSLFAYVRDLSHPSLHAIGLLAEVYGWGPDSGTGCGTGSPPPGIVNFDYAGGGWYTGNNLCTTTTSTLRYTEATTQAAPFSNRPLFRVHYTPQNLTNLVNRINNLQCSDGSLPCNCTPGVSCPQIGYSTNPANYVVEYFGVLAETLTCNYDANFQTGACSTGLTDRQVIMAGEIAAGAYSYHP
jgi:hypothetical protein